MKPFHLALAAAMLAACSAPSEDAAGLAPLTFVTEYACGGMPALVGMAGEDTVLRVDGADHILLPVETASGAKYAEAGEGPETSFWSKGDKGLLTVAGETYPECVQVSGEGLADPASVPEPVSGEVVAPEIWTARGNEPGWMLTLSDGAMTLVYEYGEKTHNAPAPAMQEIEGGRRYTEGAGGLTVTALSKVCLDTMTGLPYPDTVTAVLGETVLEGCGGDPNALLAGADWGVEELDGAGVPKGAELTMVFDPAEGRVGGTSGCNSYSAEYSVGGEGMTVGMVVATEKACAASLMDIERKFQTALDSVFGYSIDESGALVLEGENGARIVARR